LDATDLADLVLPDADVGRRTRGYANNGLILSNGLGSVNGTRLNAAGWTNMYSSLLRSMPTRIAGRLFHFTVD
jgi:hypothetical protein